MFVRDIMTQQVEHVRPEETLQDAAVKMRELEIGALPVYDGNYLLGMLSDRDITVRAVAEGMNCATTPVTEIMSPDVVSCYDDETVEDAARLMKQRLIRRLIVLDHEGKLTGIVALADLATQQPDETLLAETVENISEPIHATYFNQSAGSLEQDASDGAGMSG